MNATTNAAPQRVTAMTNGRQADSGRRRQRVLAALGRALNLSLIHI